MAGTYTYKSVRVSVENEQGETHHYHFASDVQAEGFKAMVERTWRKSEAMGPFPSFDEVDSKFQNGIHFPA